LDTVRNIDRFFVSLDIHMHPTALKLLKAKTLDSFILALRSIPLHRLATYRSVTLIAADVLARIGLGYCVWVCFW